MKCLSFHICGHFSISVADNVFQKLPEHYRYVKFDSAVARCKSQAGLNGTDDTR